MGESRKIAAILAADVVGFSRLTSIDEDRTLARLRALRSDLIDPVVALHHGRVFKRTGDGALVEFRSVVEAVRCAVEIQTGMAERNIGVPADSEIAFRIGVHLGDVVEEADGDLMGDGVNVAARLEGVAKPGAICLSEDAYRQVKARLDLGVSDLGAISLKNIAEPVRVFSLQVGTTADALPTVPPQRSSPDRASIAALPFQNMSGDAEQDYFTDGMVEDIITGLSRIKWMSVIARNSSFAYKGRAVDIRTVARELGVRYVLEGSVRKAGGRLRITAQLIEAESGVHVWADRFDGSLDDVFDFQDRITETIVGVIEPNVRRAEIERARRKHPENLDAYDLYLRALPHLVSMMPDDAEAGLPLLEAALKLDPEFAAAHAYKAWAMEVRVFRRGFRPDDIAMAERHARAALAYGADDSTALAVAGLPLLNVANDFPASSSAVARAIALNPSCALAYHIGAHVHAMGGDPKLAEEYAKQALRLSPFDPLSFQALYALGLVRMLAGNADEAASYLSKAVQANPRFSTLYVFETVGLANAGRKNEAKAAAQRLLSLEPGFRIGGFLTFVAKFSHGALVDLLRARLSEVGVPE